MITRFMDMHSGGSSKEEWSHIYIEAPESEAEIIFYNRFGHNPHRVSCTCCGPDYSIDESKTLQQSTAFDRGCKYDREMKKYIEESDNTAYHDYLIVSEYIKLENIYVIYAGDIKPEERNGELPEQGYVWQD